MKLSFVMQREFESGLQNLSDQRISLSRKNFVNDVMNLVLDQITQQHPIETGRAARAWENQRDTFRGHVSDETTESSGIQQDSSRTSSHEARRSRVIVSNHVPYVRFLEYGTSKTAPHAMVRKSLIQVRPELRNLFRIS